MANSTNGKHNEALVTLQANPTGNKAPFGESITFSLTKGKL